MTLAILGIIFVAAVVTGAIAFWTFRKSESSLGWVAAMTAGIVSFSFFLVMLGYALADYLY